MSIMTSMISAVSGMRNHSASMDVISNNIANVNTIGYKAQRLTFTEAFSQTLKYATGSSDGGGGTNPYQVGLGMQGGAIDTIFTQGTIEKTGQYSDLAVQGDDFFVVKKGNRDYYTRAGQFVLDSNGNFVNSTTGAILQGYKAVEGSLVKGVVPTDIVIPLADKSQAAQTQKITFVGNLNSTTDSAGFMSGGSMYAPGDPGSSDITSLLASDGTTLNNLNNAVAGETQVTVNDTVGNSYTFYYVVGTPEAGSRQFNNLNGLYSEIKKEFPGFDAALSQTSLGQYTLSDSKSQIASITSNNAYLNSALNSSASLGTTETFYRPAQAADNITDLIDSSGVKLNANAQTSDVYTLAWKENGYATSVKFSGVTTVSDFLENVKDRLPFAQSVSIDPASGKLVVIPSATSTVAVTDLSLTAADSAGTEIDTFDKGMKSFTNPVGTPVVSNVSVYDSQGDKHLVTFSFSKTATNTWLWTATYDIPGATTGSTITKTAGYGNLVFTPGGSLAVSTSNGIQLVTTNGSTKEIKAAVDWGKPNTFLGMTQVENPTSLNNSQDGYAAGDLINVNIDEQGKIIGNYSNGQFKTLGQVAMAKFRNPSGLMKEGESLYTESINSGDPMLETLDSSSLTKIVSGGLEQSTVDLTEEFTNMIIIQRGYQANAKMITTADEMTQDLVGLKR
jgi:flagellar hook protein FlgE